MLESKVAKVELEQGLTLQGRTEPPEQMALVLRVRVLLAFQALLISHHCFRSIHG